MTATIDVPNAPVDEDALCDGCGYNVRALERSGSCPECGAAVEASVRLDRLRRAGQPKPLPVSDPTWVREQREGCVLLLLAAAWQIAWALGRDRTNGDLRWIGWIGMMPAADVVGDVIACWGLWKLGARER